MDHGKLKIEHSEPTKTGSVKCSRRVCTIYTSRVTHAKSHVICYKTWRKSFNKVNDYKKKTFTCMTQFFKLVLSFVMSLCSLNIKCSRLFNLIQLFHYNYKQLSCFLLYQSRLPKVYIFHLIHRALFYNVFHQVISRPHYHYSQRQRKHSNLYQQLHDVVF